MKLKYLTVIMPEECTDGTACFRAEHPQLPGCMSHGLTREEAIRNLIDAKCLYIETLLEKGLEVPLPVQPTVLTWSSSQSIMKRIAPIIKESDTVKIHLPSECDMSQAAA
jgi:predicted RNase H-like HicB family nuclease